MRRPARPLFRRNPLRHFETLEGRRLLAGDVVGTVLNDTDGNGVGETALVGQQVLLYQDNGNGTFLASEESTPVSVLTTTGGNYRFADVAAGNYFVVLGTLNDRTQLSPAAPPAAQMLVNVGDVNLTIDDFSTSQSASAVRNLGDPIPSPGSSADGANAGAGGVRDLRATFTSGNFGSLAISSNEFNSGNLSITASNGVVGTLSAVWDGVDGSTSTVNSTGLTLDLLNGGQNDAFLVRAAGDRVYDFRLRIHDRTGNVSEVTVTSIDVVGGLNGDAAETLNVPFSSFTGNANFANVGAIELLVDASGNAFDGDIGIVGVIGDTDGPDFTVQNVMSLGNLVFLDQNNDGMFMAPTDTGIGGVVLNLLFDANRNGTFTQIDTQTTATTGTVGSYLFTGLAPGDYRVEVAQSNFAVDAALEGLFTSTGNDVAMGMPLDPDDPAAGDHKDRGFDDTDSGTIRSKPITLLGGQEVAGSGNEAQNVDFGFWGFDLKIEKTPDTQVATPGGTVTYTLTPRNERPGALGTLAENVQVIDLLPPGLTFEPTGSTTGATTTTVGGREQVTYSIGNLAAGVTGTPLTVVARVPSNLTAAPTQANQATISNATEPTVYANNVVDDNLDTALLTLNAPAVSIGKRAFFWSTGLFNNPA